MRFGSLYVTCAVVFSAGALKLPDYIKSCSRHDPKFNECALKHGREAIPRLIKGDPKYGVPVLDPFAVQELTIQVPTITMTGHNFTAEGLNDTVLQDISVDFDKQTISIQLQVPLIALKGKYEMTGKMASLPLTGNGNFHTKFYDAKIKYVTLFNLTKKEDGKTYLLPYDYELSVDPKKVTVDLGNLFNGNKVLGNVVQSVLNENWRIALDEVGKPTYRTLGLVVHQIMTNVAQKVPYDELFTDSD